VILCAGGTRSDSMQLQVSFTTVIIFYLLCMSSKSSSTFPPLYCPCCHHNFTLLTDLGTPSSDYLPSQTHNVLLPLHSVIIHFIHYFIFSFHISFFVTVSITLLVSNICVVQVSYERTESTAWSRHRKLFTWSQGI
jgi:hypothetical protein